MTTNNIFNTFSIYDRDSIPYGKTYEEWTIQWWRWLVSIPRDMSPACDQSGELSGISQNNPNVWYLAGTFEGTATRKIKIPHGKAILLPVINFECSFADEKLIKNEYELEKRCVDEIDKIADLKASLDGTDIDIQKYRVHSRCFQIEIPSDNCLCSPAGMTTMSSDGFWLFIKSLPRGTHEIKTFGSCLAGRIKIGCSLEIQIE